MPQPLEIPKKLRESVKKLKTRIDALKEATGKPTSTPAEKPK